MAKNLKLKWRVSPSPTGRYRSFENRAWPMAYVNGTADDIGDAVAYITCADEYRPSNVKTGKHAELTVNIADRLQGSQGWHWRRLKKKFSTLDEAKQAAQAFFDKHPQYYWGEVEKHVIKEKS